MPPEVTVGIKQYRLDYAPRALEISVTNDSSDVLSVTAASFASPHFDTDGSDWTRDIEVPAGSTRDLKVLLGAPVCDADARVDEASVSIDFVTADGTVGHATTVPADELGTLAKVTAEDCIAERTAAVAEITTGASLRTEVHEGRPVALLDVAATPTGRQGALTIESIGPTTLIRAATPGDGWPLAWQLSATSGARSTTLEIVPSNCNPHILAEDKRGTYLPLTVVLSDGTSGIVPVDVGATVRAQIYAYFADYCW